MQAVRVGVELTPRGHDAGVGVGRARAFALWPLGALRTRAHFLSAPGSELVLGCGWDSGKKLLLSLQLYVGLRTLTLRQIFLLGPWVSVPWCSKV